MLFKKVFIDTSAWINYILEGEPYHQEASEYFETEIKRPTKFFTSNLIIVETATRLLYDHSLKISLEFKKRIKEAENQKRLAVLWVDEPILEQGWEFFEKFAEHKLSLTDATTVSLVKEFKLTSIFAFDDDFRKVGINVEPT